MRFFQNVQSRALVTGLGESAILTEASVKRRDTEVFELQLFTGAQGVAENYQLAESFEMRFLAKLPNDWTGPAVVMSTSFVYDAELLLYRATPSFNTDRLLQHFLSAAELSLLSTGRDLVAADLNNLLIVTVGSGGSTVTVSAALEAAAVVGSKLYLCASTATTDVLTVAAASGISVTRDPDLGLSANEMLGGTYLQLRKTAANTWILEQPTEVDEVSLMGEFTYRELSAPTAWRSTDNFTLIIRNDVARGDEGAPITVAAADLFVTRAELLGGYLLADTCEARYHRSDSARSYDATRQKHARDNAGLVLNTQTLTDGATINWDMALGLNAVVTLGGNRTLAAPTNPPFIGASGHLIVIQDGTGDRTLTLNSAFVKEYLGNALDAAAGSVSVIRWIYDGTKYRLHRIASTKDDLVSQLSGFSEAQLELIQSALGIRGLNQAHYIDRTSTGTDDLVLASLTIPAPALELLPLVELEAWGTVSNTTTASNLVLWVKVGGTKYFSTTQALGTTASGGKEFRASGLLMVKNTSLSALTFVGSLDTRWSTTDVLNANYAETTGVDATSGVQVQIGANVSAGSSSIFNARGFVKYMTGS